jgi:hypothetical protein
MKIVGLVLFHPVSFSAIAQVKDGRWGYRLLVVDDPDGNQLFFNYPNETDPGRY